MRRPNVLLALAGVAILTVASLPATRWLVRAHISGAQGSSGRLDRTLVELGLRRDDLPFPRLWDLPSLPVRELSTDVFAAAHPDNEAVQIARAVRQGQGRDVEALRLMPPNVATLATAIRLDSRSIRPHDPGSWRLIKATPPAGFSVRPPQESTRVVPMLADAVRAQKQDPDNGFFPAMTAVGWQAMGKTTEAMQCLKLAAGSPRWEDYAFVEARGQIALDEGAGGRMPVVGAVARSASILFPHYAQIRNLTRVAALEAVEREQKGDTKGGLAIRRDVIGLGVTMRDQSRSLIGALVGAAIVDIGTLRPGSAAPTEDRDVLERQWAAWASAHGAPDLADAPVRNREIRDTMQRMVRAASERSVFGMGAVASTFMGIAALLVLGNGLVLLLVAALLTALRRPLPVLARVALCLAWLTISALVVGNFLKTPAALWAMGEVLQRLVVTTDSGASLPPATGLLWTIRLAIAVGALATVTLPALLIAAGVAHRKERAGCGYVRQFAHIALPTASTLILIYCVAMPLLVSWDGRQRADLGRLMVDERSYYRSLID